MANKIKTENVDDIIKSLEEEKQALTDKIAAKTAEYDAKALEKRNQFIEMTVNPLQKKVTDLKEEIVKYQKIKSILG